MQAVLTFCNTPTDALRFSIVLQCCEPARFARSCDAVTYCHNSCDHINYSRASAKRERIDVKLNIAHPPLGVMRIILNKLCLQKFISFFEDRFPPVPCCYRRYSDLYCMLSTYRTLYDHLRADKSG